MARAKPPTRPPRSATLIWRASARRRVLLGVAIFAATYALLAIPALPRLVRRVLELAPSERARRIGDRLLGRPAIALVGAALVVLVGAVSWREAWGAINFPTLALLVGMMLLVAGLEAANAFVVLASRLARALPTPRRLLVGSMVAVAVLSALVLNDAVVLLFTPVLIRAAREMRVSAFPFLAGEAFAANIGSAATPVGNPQNAAIALAYDITFVEFAAAITPVAIVSLGLAILACLVAFRRSLARPRAEPNLLSGAALGATHVPGPAPSSMRGDAPRAHRKPLALALAAIAAALVGFVAGPSVGVPLWVSAAGAGMLVLTLAPWVGVDPRRVVKSVDVGILAFFVGLFVLVDSLGRAGGASIIAAALEGAGTGGLVVVTAVLSNVVSNVPAVLLLLPAVAPSDGILLAAASTFAGNATFLGSAATVIVAGTARVFGEEFEVGRFARVGAPLAVASLALAWFVLG